MLSWISQNKKRKRIATIVISVFFVAIFLFFANAVYAQVEKQAELNFGMAQVEQNIGLSGDDIRMIIARIVRVVLGLLGTLAVCIMIWAGYTIMTAGGNEEKIQEGKKIMTNAVIGLIIILSAFAIVQFVINMLAQATGIMQGDVKKVKIETFAGSGALGKIVKDHYPMRDQKDVPRNTKIMITFAEAMDPSSFIDNTNKTCWPETGDKPIVMDDKGTGCAKDGNKIKEYFGDCITGKDTFDWDKDCDHLKIEKDGNGNPKSVQNFHIYQSKDAGKTPVVAAAMASYVDGKADTFVFKPIKPLGDNLEKFWYTVRLNNSVKKEKKIGNNSVGAFDGQHYQFYSWEFQTDTIFDFSPPRVVSVYPSKGGTEARNTIVQVNFNEAMDPMVTQGVIKQGGSFSHMIINYGKTSPVAPTASTTFGSWTISNGYRTAEFVPKNECGTNSCGEKMYCLDLQGCAKNDLQCTNAFATLVRTGMKIGGGAQPFEAIPFSGVMDAAGNALDGNKDNKYQTPPGKGFLMIGADEVTSTPEKYVPDNYGWDFNILNKIDRVSPYITILTPNLDQGGVAEDEEVRVNFSKLMWLKTIKDMSLEEYPEAFATDSDGKKVAVDFYYYLTSSLDSPKTITWIKHRIFGPNDTDYYYAPIIPGSVKALNQNCLYPGFGPGVNQIEPPAEIPKCVLSDYDDFGSAKTVINCAPTTNQTTSSTDTGCVQTYEDVVNNVPKQTASSTPPCLNYLKDNSPDL